MQFARRMALIVVGGEDGFARVAGGEVAEGGEAEFLPRGLVVVVAEEGGKDGHAAAYYPGAHFGGADGGGGVRERWKDGKMERWKGGGWFINGGRREGIKKEDGHRERLA